MYVRVCFTCLILCSACNIGSAVVSFLVCVPGSRKAAKQRGYGKKHHNQAVPLYEDPLSHHMMYIGHVGDTLVIESRSILALRVVLNWPNGYF